MTTTRPPSKRASFAASAAAPGQVVEREDAVHPAGAGQAFGLLGHEPGARRDDQDVVLERGSAREVDHPTVDVDMVDLRLDEVDAVVQLVPRGFTMSAGRAQPNGTNNRPGW